jgi:hypothetical protein
MTANPDLRRAATSALLTLAIAPLATAQFYGDPPDETHPWAVHDQNRPQPPRVEPGKTPGAPPSDAIVLFDGTEAALANWEHEKDKRKGDWIVKDGALQCTPGAGYIRSKEQFGDCQLHVEWSAPSEVKGDGQGRGNSGVFLMGMTEVQVLDNLSNPTYPDGFAASVYGVNPPMVNPLNKPGEWQTYDIVFRRPIVKDGKVIDPGSQTVLLNGVLVQAATPLEGGGGHKGRSNPLRVFPEKGPLKIQDHGNPVRFRNIWYRNIRKRATDGGTDGQLSPEATTAKRNEIAAEIRADAATKQGKDKMLRLMESLCYETNQDALNEAAELGSAFVEDLRATPADKIQARKGETMQVNNAMKYLAKHQRIPADVPLIAELQEIIKTNGWSKKR